MHPKNTADWRRAIINLNKKLVYFLKDGFGLSQSIIDFYWGFSVMKCQKLTFWSFSWEHCFLIEKRPKVNKTSWLLPRGSINCKEGRHYHQKRPSGSKCRQKDWGTVWKNTKFPLTKKNSWNQLSRNFISKNVAFTKFVSKTGEKNFR